MSGSVPPILWYLLAFLAFAVFPLTMVWAIHRHKMKVLEILRSYAEKGIEPPAAVTEVLLRQSADPGQKWKSTPRGSLLNTFGIHLWIACIFGCIAWWRLDAGNPRWLIYIAVGSAVFFALLAVGQLAAALKSPLK
jgi:hypothetical protein